MKILVFMLFFVATPAWSAPFEVVLQQHKRQHKISGKITLREPVTDRVLGSYEFVSGGLGRGGAPFGQYEVGEFQGMDWDPLHIGPRWLIRHSGPGVEDGYAWDIDLQDWRTELELHMLHAGRLKATLGCIGIDGGPKVYAEFMAHLRMLIAWLGVVRFELKPEQPIAVAEGK